MVVVLTFGWWYPTRWEALLLLVATQILQMVQQLMPMLRFDGYHLLADLTGVPDLYQRIRPTLLGLLPHRWSDPANRVLKPWARAVITVWVLVTIPMMAIMLVALVTAVPRVLGTAWAVVQEDARGRAGRLAQRRSGRRRRPGAPGAVRRAAGAGGLPHPRPDRAADLARARRVEPRLAAQARRRPGAQRRRRHRSLLGVDARTGNLPSDRPRTRKGLLTALLPAAQEADAADEPARSTRRSGGRLARAGAAATQRLASAAPLPATFPQGVRSPARTTPGSRSSSCRARPPATSRPRPLRRPRPVPPRISPTTSAPSTSAPTAGPTSPAGTEEAQPWVFPFDEPLPPSEGDNQAAAYNTRDDSVVYDVAFALVWATGDEVLDVNEAYAFASCSNCVTVAVAFQVVLIMDDAHVVVPQNLSVAANYSCYRCITAAIASQLVLSVDGTSDEELRALGEVWGRLTELGRSITEYSLVEISDRLEAFKTEIVAILGDAPPLVGATSTSSATETPTGTEGTAAPTGPPSAGSPSSGSPSSGSSSAPSAAQSGSPVSPDGSSTPTPSQPASPSQPPSPSPSPAPTQEATPPTAESPTVTPSAGPTDTGSPPPTPSP